MKEQKAKGVVTKSTGKWYEVRLENEEMLRCRIVGKFRLHGQKLTNPVAVGDIVDVMLLKEEENTGMIEHIYDRKNSVVRQSPRQKHHLHLLASNIDQALLVSTIKEPNLKQGFIDRFLLMTEPHDIPTHIIFNKADLYDEDALAIFEGLQLMYENIGYKVYLVSALSGQGIEELRQLLTGKTSLIGGQSGVGKSSLLNAIEPSLTLRTSMLSGRSGKGQHTTTFAEMVTLKKGSYLIDTPGIKTLSYNYLEPLDVAHNFREFFALSSQCRFHNCTHRNEPGCAVKEAIEEGYISPLRYDNYLVILDEIEEQNTWERH